MGDERNDEAGIRENDDAVTGDEREQDGSNDATGHILLGQEDAPGMATGQEDAPGVFVAGEEEAPGFYS